MKHKILLLLSMFACSVFTSHVAWSAPPSSCAKNFVGTWVYAGGTTIVRGDGTAYPKCAMCVPMQRWTCNGNTYLFSNSGPPGQFSATLVGPNRMQGSGVVATRVGGGAGPEPRAAKKAAAKAEEPGLIEGNRWGRLPTRAKREAYDIAQQMLTAALGSWIDRAEDNLALKERIRSKMSAMNRAAESGRMREARHEYDTVKPLIAEARKRGLKLSRRFDVLIK